MAGRKISEQESTEIKQALYQYILAHPGLYRYQLANAYLSAPGDILCYQLRALMREGKIWQDEKKGRGPLSQLYPLPTEPELQGDESLAKLPQATIPKHARSSGTQTSRL